MSQETKKFSIPNLPSAPEYCVWQLEKAEYHIDEGFENFEYDVWTLNLIEPGEDVLSQLIHDLSDDTIVSAAWSIVGRYVSRNRARALEDGPVVL